MTDDMIDKFYDRLKKDAEASGYRLNPDAAFVKEIIRGLLTNEERFGYQACPCRLASGTQKEDLDIICPCDYRDPDLTEYGSCYCALYVSEEIANGEASAQSIPERRNTDKEEAQAGVAKAVMKTTLPYPVWRCKVCGYLCARDAPPGICPVCKAKKDRFERFM
jgi:ferredoxin-thioredoxin reductase catalytic chain